MKNQNLSILFVIKLNKQNKKGLCPLNFRITYLKKRKEISSGIFVNPQKWDSKRQRTVLSTIGDNQINLQIEIITTDIKKAHLQLQLAGDEFSVEDIFNNYIGKPTAKEVGTIQYFKEFLEKKKKLIGIDIQLGTCKKFNYTNQQVKDFIKWKYSKQDHPLSKLKLQFLHDFEYYLKTERKQSQVTINKAIQRFRKPIKEVVGEGYLDKDHLYCTSLAGSGKRLYSFLLRSYIY